MALLECEDCGKSVSDRASSCPSCGCPIETTKRESASVLGKPKFSPYRPSEITETFGFDPKDAIPTPSIQATESVYLPLLATPDKTRIEWKRKGSFSYDFGIVDQFDLFDQNDLLIYSVFVNPYANELSERAPQGLIVFRPMKDIHQKMMQEKPELKRKLDSAFKDALAGSNRNNDKMTKDEWLGGIGCLAFIAVAVYMLYKWLIE